MLKKIISVTAVGGLATILTMVGSNVIARKEVEEQQVITENRQEETLTEVESLGISIVLDPGHGGYDPGKVGVNNALEKDINLAIGLKVREDLVEKGYDVIMTRDADSSMRENGSDLGKVQDLDARVKVINQSEAILAVSIHQNSYITEDVKGAQVFYYEHSVAGEVAAGIMQGALLTVEPNNHRQIKANDSYYLLKRTMIPTIIVECGFLSNRDEANKLCDDTYQEELAASIVSGIEKYSKSL